MSLAKLRLRASNRYRVFLRKLILAVRTDWFFLVGINFCDFQKVPNTQHWQYFRCYWVRAIEMHIFKQYYGVRQYFIVNVSAPLWRMLNAKWLNYKTNNDKLAIMGEHCGSLPCVTVLRLPCARLACATSGDGMGKEPHLSPQHYELNAIQHVLDRTRVSVCRRY